MKITKRIIDTLPSFYGTWSKESLFFLLLFSFGNCLEESQNDLFRVMKSHWVDTAIGEDLDNLGSIYNLKRKSEEKDTDYRKRLKLALFEYKGGGTIKSIIFLVRNYLGMHGEEKIEIIENPSKELNIEYKVKSGESWRLCSNSIENEIPIITFYVDAGDTFFDSAKFNESVLPFSVKNPVIYNLETNESIGFTGLIKGGQKLILKNKSSTLDGEDVSNQISSNNPPSILRKGSVWKYEEALIEKIGIFDEANFDSSLFKQEVATVKINYQWVARQPAAFELRIPKDSQKRSGIPMEDLKEFVDRIKAIGVKAILVLVD